MSGKTRRLVLLRHGQAEMIMGDDYHRKLTDVGREEAKKSALKLLERGWCPQGVVVSEAIRAHDTFKIAEATCRDLAKNSSTASSSAGPVELQTRITRDLYLASVNGIIGCLETEIAQWKGVETLMAVGHNPGISETVGELTGQLVGLDTAAAALMTIEADSWEQALASPGEWDLEDIINPGR